jgi:hypothetical protein
MGESLGQLAKHLRDSEHMITGLFPFSETVSLIPQKEDDGGGDW